MVLEQFNFISGTDLERLVQNIPSRLVYNPFTIVHTADAVDNHVKALIIPVVKYDTQDTPASYVPVSAPVGYTISEYDSNDSIVVSPKRVADAQAGYRVVGVASAAVVRSEFNDYIIIGNLDDATVLYVGTLKVSKTDVYTPSFLSTTNVQFNG